MAYANIVIVNYFHYSLKRKFLANSTIIISVIFGSYTLVNLDLYAQPTDNLNLTAKEEIVLDKELFSKISANTFEVVSPTKTIKSPNIKIPLMEIVQNQSPRLIINFRSPPEAEVAGELNLKSPYRQYFNVIWSIRDDPVLKDIMLSYLSSAMVVEDKEKALTIAEFVSNPIYKVDALISIANAYIDSGSDELAKDILSITKKELTRLSSDFTLDEKENLKESISRYVGVSYDFLGPNQTIETIGTVKNPFLFGLMLTNFIARLGSPVPGSELSEKRNSAPEAILDISFNKLQNLKEKSSYLHSLLTLSSYYLSQNTETSFDKFRGIIEIVKKLLIDNPQIVSLNNHKTFLSHMITLEQFDEAIEYTETLQPVELRIEVLLSVARSLFELGETEKALRLFIVISKLIDNEVVDEEKKENLKLALIGHLTEIDRLSDGFDIILEATDKVIIAKRASYMASKLISNNKIKEAELLWKYIPYANLRAELLFDVAKYYLKAGNKDKANEFLITALQENNYLPGTTDLDSALLLDIINFSKTYNNDADYKKVYTIVEYQLTEKNSQLNNIYTELALLENEFQYLDPSEDSLELEKIKNRTLELYSQLWPYKSEKLYVPSLANLVTLLAKLDEYQTALTLAAAIPIKIIDKDSLIASKEAISNVIRETMDDGQIELAAKAFDSIPFESERRLALLRILKSLAREPSHSK